jgi:hypothetical protein
MVQKEEGQSLRLLLHIAKRGIHYSTLLVNVLCKLVFASFVLVSLERGREGRKIE